MARSRVLIDVSVDGVVGSRSQQFGYAGIMTLAFGFAGLKHMRWRQGPSTAIDRLDSMIGSITAFGRESMMMGACLLSESSAG